jgi:hypothetical protein
MPLFRPRSRRCPLTSRSASTRTACFALAGLGGRDPWSQAGTTFAKRLHEPQRAQCLRALQPIAPTGADRALCAGRYNPGQPGTASPTGTTRSLMGSDRSPAVQVDNSKVAGSNRAPGVRPNTQAFVETAAARRGAPHPTGYLGNTLYRRDRVGLYVFVTQSLYGPSSAAGMTAIPSGRR